jgi:hypothetical protein
LGSLAARIVASSMIPQSLPFASQSHGLQRTLPASCASLTYLVSVRKFWERLAGETPKPPAPLWNVACRWANPLCRTSGALSQDRPFSQGLRAWARLFRALRRCGLALSGGCGFRDRRRCGYAVARDARMCWFRGNVQDSSFGLWHSVCDVTSAAEAEKGYQLYRRSKDLLHPVTGDSKS